MALEGYARNLYGVSMFGDLSVVVIKINGTGRIAADSSPDTTVGTPASGAYAVTYPAAQQGWVLGAALVQVAGATHAEVTAFAPTLGTLTVDTGSDLTGNDECHLFLLLARN